MEYIVDEINVDDKSLENIVSFLQESFPKNKKFSFDFIKWQYTDNPIGKMVGYNALDDKGKIVSHFAGLPIAMSLHGKERKGLLCINVATAEEYRGRKLFTELGTKTMEYAQQNGFDFMIAVPNANSSPGFLKYFGFYLISPLSVELGFGTNIYDNRIFTCFKTWDIDQLKWRIKNPANKYYRNDDNIIFSPISFFFKTISKNKIREDVVSENISLKKIFCRPFNLYIGLGADTNRGFYIRMPSFIKRPPFNVVFKDLTGGSISTITKEDLFLQLIDLDTI